MAVLRTGSRPTDTPRTGSPLPRTPREGARRAWDAPTATRRAVRYDAPTDPRATRLDAPAGDRTVMRAPTDRLGGRQDAPTRTSTRGWIA